MFAARQVLPSSIARAAKSNVIPTLGSFGIQAPLMALSQSSIFANGPTVPTMPHAGIGSVRSLQVPFVIVPKRKMYRSRRALIAKRLRAEKDLYIKPTMDIANVMPTSMQEVDNTTVVSLAAMGFHDARKEMLKRHIMKVDKVPYEKATETFLTIQAKNREYNQWLAMPYRLGISVALFGGIFSVPMVFHLPTVHWFNELFVTTDVPQPKDLETALEVGSWSWNWMEPPLGTISFVILAFQFVREQLDNLGLKPYTEKVKDWRAERLASAFPQYNAEILLDFSRSSPLYK